MGSTIDSTGKAAGSRDGFTATDIPENMELIAHQRIVRFDGKEYLILAQSKRTFSNEGIPLAEDTYFESFEIKGTEQIRDGILLGNTLGSTDPFGKILRESLHISHDLINNVQNIEHRNFMGEGVGSLLNPEMGIWVGKLDMKTPVNPEVVYIKRPQFPALPDKASQNVPPQNKLPQNELSSEVSQGQEKLIGQVLSSEKKEVRSSWEEVAKDMYGFGTGFVKAPVEMARESKEVALTVFKYANKPMEEKVLQVVGGLVKIYQFNKEHNFEEKKQLAKEIGRELLKDVVETVTEPEKQGRFTAEVTLGLGVPRVLKGIKIVGKVVDETTDVTALSKRDLGVGVKEVELLDKPKLKLDVDAEDLVKEVDIEARKFFKKEVGEKEIELPLESDSLSSKLIGPVLPEKIADAFKDGYYSNRKLSSNEIYYRYHGTDNREGYRFSWVTNKKYFDELSLRSDLAIRDDWGIKIEMVTELEIPAGTWISEGYAAPQGLEYAGGGYQAAILEISKNWIKTTKKAFD